MPGLADTDSVRGGTALPAPGVLDELTVALTSARNALAGLLDLLTLEARRAGLALVWMAACGLMAAICLFATWLGLMAAVSLWTISLGLPAIAAVIAVAAINLAAAALLIRVCLGKSEALRFPATRRQVAGLPPGQPAAS
jgi:hypothetical protein